MQTFWRDLTVGCRRLRATPAFTFFSILTLALGIAAVTGAYAMVRAAAAPPPGVPDVHELLTLSHTRSGGPAMVAFSLPDFEDLRRRQTTMDDVVAFATIQQVLAVDGRSRTSLGEGVSGSYFRVLRVNAAVGRTIQPDDDRPGATPVAVISHDVWHQMFAGRADVVGRTVRLNGHPFDIVGVAAPGFGGLFGNGHFPAMTWVPLSAMHRLEHRDVERDRTDRNARWLYVRARQAAGNSMEHVAAEVGAIGRQLDLEQPLGLGLTDPRLFTPYRMSREWVVRHSQDLLIDETSSVARLPVAVLLMAAVCLVLLVACTNLANLVLARGLVRRHELALRIALGAPRGRLLCGCIAEVLIITAAGCVLGLSLTWLVLASTRGPVDGSRGIIFLLEPRMDPAAFAVGAAAVLLTLVVAGLMPAWILTRRSSHAELASGAAPTVVPRWRVRRLLISAQVAVSIVLLAAAALFFGQVLAQSRFHGGLELDRFAVAEVDLALQNYDDERSTRLVDHVLNRLERHPAIESAAASSGLPVGPTAPVGSVRAAGDAITTQVIGITGDFFRTSGIRMVRGAVFDAATSPDGLLPAVVDADLAQRLFGHTEVVGQQIEVRVRTGGGEGEPVPETRAISGVVTSAGDGSTVRPHAIYVPLVGRPTRPLVFSARTSDDPARIAEEIRAAVFSADPEVGISQVGSARAIAGPATGIGMVAVVVSTLLGSIGLMVVLAGLYGVLSFLVSRRTREIGMRLALGATPHRVLFMVIREGLAPVVAGMVVGTVVAVGVSRLLPFRLPAVNLLLLACVPVLMLVTTAIACYFPARRAANISPARALKQ